MTIKGIINTEPTSNHSTPDSQSSTNSQKARTAEEGEGQVSQSTAPQWKGRMVHGRVLDQKDTVPDLQATLYFNAAAKTDARWKVEVHRHCEQQKSRLGRLQGRLHQIVPLPNTPLSGGMIERTRVLTHCCVSQCVPPDSSGQVRGKEVTGPP